MHFVILNFNPGLVPVILRSDILERRESEVRAPAFTIIFAVPIFANKLTVVAGRCRLFRRLAFF